LQKGDKISEYILVEPIGRGGFGQVWKAKHEILPDKFVAIKIPTDEHFIEQLRSEGILQHTLHHPNIVTTLGLSITSTPPYFIMDLIEGESLRDRLKTAGKLPVGEAVRIITQVTKALAYAHKNGVVHTDIKPENILIDKNGKALLSDFGLGKVSQNLSASLALEGSLITKEGHSIAGTLEYMSPEQQQGEEFGPESDVYSLGIVLFEALTGERPQPQDVPSDLVGGVPQQLDRIFTKCYTRAAKRYKNAMALLKALNRFQQGKKDTKTAAVKKMPFKSAEEPISGCLVVMFMILGSLAGFLVGLAVFRHPVTAIAGAGIGLVLGARLIRPRYLIVTLGGTVAGAVLGRGVIGALLGAIVAEIVVTFIEMGKSQAE